MTDLEREAAERFPQWSPQMRARWCAAKLAAARIEPKWCRLIPLTVDQIPRADQFAPRVLRKT